MPRRYRPRWRMRNGKLRNRRGQERGQSHCPDERRGNRMVGATGVEPARIAPQDPKSCASANSATRPLPLEFFATEAAGVNIFRDAGLAHLGVPPKWLEKTLTRPT